MLAHIKRWFQSLNPANNSSFVSKQLKNPNGMFASKVAKGMNVSNKYLYDLTLQNLDLNNDENVLEIGFGNGFYFKQLNEKHQSANLYGVEISKEMINQCSYLNKKLIADKKLEIKHFDGLRLPYENEMFDTIIAINLIYFWENPIENISELNRVLKIDGELKIGVRPFNILSQLPFAKENFNIQKDEWWIELFNKNGFSLINNESTSELPIIFNGEKYNMSGACWTFKKI